MIRWNDNYKIGIEEIDTQHKRFFDIADYTFNLLKDNLIIDKYDRIIAILNELKDYTKYHFRTEEEFMEKIRYKKLLSHKVEHKDFIRTLEEIDLSKIDQDQEGYTLELLDMILNWLSNHILKSDAEFGRFYREVNS